MSLRSPPAFLRLLWLCLLAGRVGASLAQGACTSEAVPKPVLLVERFIADSCEECWRIAPAPTPKGAIVADWIVPSGNPDAPLAAAALTEASQRLRFLGAAPDSRASEQRRPISQAIAGRLRLAQGPVVNDYLGVSIRWQPPAGGQNKPLDAWVLLLEDIPAGVAGSTAARVLVRGAWAAESIVATRAGWTERRAMHVPASADPAQLRLAAWLTDRKGAVTMAAATRCPT